MGCSGMTAQQEGLYMRLFCHLGTANGRGLPNDFNFIYRMVADPSEDAELVQHQKEDLMWVITHKLTLIDGRYHQTSSKPSESDSESYNYIWSKLSIKRGSKTVAYSSWLKFAKDIKPDTLIEKYNALCSQSDDPKFIPHFSTWLNHSRWEEELPTKIDNDNFGIQTKKSHKDYVYAVKKGMRLLTITDDMVRQMRKENLITEEEFKKW